MTARPEVLCAGEHNAGRCQIAEVLRTVSAHCRSSKAVFEPYLRGLHHICTTSFKNGGPAPLQNPGSRPGSGTPRQPPVAASLVFIPTFHRMMADKCVGGDGGGDPMSDLNVIPLVDEGLGNSAYLVDLADGRALAVDASRDLRRLRAVAQRRGLRLAYAADTHLHADFLTGAVALAASDGATVLASAAGNREFPQYRPGGRRRGRPGWADAADARDPGAHP